MWLILSLVDLKALGRLCMGMLIVFMVLITPMMGVFMSPWMAWWFAGNTTAEPGMVPPAAVVAPQGPLLGDITPLMAAIQPYMNVRYWFGGNDARGIDCSGLIVAVARAMGWPMPWRTAQSQYDHTERVGASNLQFGDLVFFERTYSSHERVTHVGWYIGDGMMISAIEPVVGRQSLSSPFWSSHYVGAGRIRR